MRIGYNSDFRPFTWQDGEEAHGDLINICRELFLKAEISAQFVALELMSGQLALQNGEIDALVGIAISPHRKDRFLFSQPLIQTGGAWFVLMGTDWQDDLVLQGLQESQLAVTTPTGGPLLAEIKADFPALNLTPCDDYNQALQLVVEGTVQAAALNIHVGTRMVTTQYPGCFRIPVAPFFHVALGIAVLPGDQSGMIDRINCVMPGL